MASQEYTSVRPMTSSEWLYLKWGQAGFVVSGFFAAEFARLGRRIISTLFTLTRLHAVGETDRAGAFLQLKKQTSIRPLRSGCWSGSTMTTSKATAITQGTNAYITPGRWICWKKMKQEDSLPEVERNVTGSIPWEDVAFSIFCLGFMFVLFTYAYSELVVCNSHRNSGSLTWLVIVLVFSLQKYRPRTIIKKPTIRPNCIAPIKVIRISKYKQCLQISANDYFNLGPS